MVKPDLSKCRFWVEPNPNGFGYLIKAEITNEPDFGVSWIALVDPEGFSKTSELAEYLMNLIVADQRIGDRDIDRDAAINLATRIDCISAVVGRNIDQIESLAFDLVQGAKRNANLLTEQVREFLAGNPQSPWRPIEDLEDDPPLNIYIIGHPDWKNSTEGYRDLYGWRYLKSRVLCDPQPTHYIPRPKLPPK